MRQLLGCMDHRSSVVDVGELHVHVLVKDKAIINSANYCSAMYIEPVNV